MLSPARVVIAVLLSIGCSGCSLGFGSMAPGIDTWVFNEVTGRSYHRKGKVVSSGPFDTVRESYRRRSITSSLGLTFGGEVGAAFLSAPGWSRRSGGIAAFPSIQGRYCPGSDLCLGLDVGKVGASSAFSQQYTTADGTYEQKATIGIEGWMMKPILQFSPFEPVWIEAGAGGSKTAIQFKRGNADTVDSERKWGFVWSAGAGVAFNESLGLRLQYTHLAADGTISGESLDTAGSMWTISLLID